MQRIVLAFLFLAFGSVHADEPRWFHFPAASTKYPGKSTYADVMNHCHGATQWYGDYPTTAHENAHGIHSFLRNNFKLPNGRRHNGFYAGANRAILIEEPGVRISQVRNFVPTSLRGGRFQLYLVSQTRDWDNEPLYILDEGVAYLLDAQVGIETPAENNGSTSDTLIAPLEFSIYATALGMTVKQHTPAYWKAHADLRTFLGWYVRNAIKVHREGIKLPQYQFASPLYGRLKGPEGALTRAFWQHDLGLDVSALLK